MNKQRFDYLQKEVKAIGGIIVTYCFGLAFVEVGKISNWIGIPKTSGSEKRSNELFLEKVKNMKGVTK